MQIGISSSCLYPMLLEESLKSVGELGAKTAEIFVNSFSELEKPIVTELKAIKDYYALDLRSFHPFTSAYETNMFFSDYKRRTLDSVDFYKKYFDVANELGSEMIVLHGGLSAAKTTPERYAESYILLNKAAMEAGLYIAHENVREHHCSSPDFMKKLADLVGDDFRMVLDIKQCRRSGVSEFSFIELLGDKISQVHLSDCGAGEDCLPPGAGEYDFAELFAALNAAGYDKSAVIELYRRNFGEPRELQAAKSYLEKV